MSVVKMSGITDASRPNAGRIYDYLLGGSHNFEIDRQTAQSVLEIAPFFSEMFRLIRWFLGETTRRLCDEGFRKFLDFGSGSPTMDNIHQVAPKGTKVIYSDADPLTVVYAQQIIGENPLIRYVQCDAGEPGELLNSAVIDELFEKDRKIAIGFTRVSWFLQDDMLAQSIRTIYDWAAKGSKLFLCENDVPELTPQAHKMVDLYEKIQKLHIRSKKRVEDLIGSWTVLEPGFMPLEDWVGLDRKVTEEMSQSFGGAHMGAILEKK
jgi:hypothetical protein